MDILSELNVQQLEAVTTRAKATLVLAGAGSGKTKTLTTRIAYLMSERGVFASNILALTFTRKAAQEMKERLEKLVGEKEAKKLTIGTFHAVSLRILEQHGSKLGYSSNISVYDEMDQLDILTAVMNEYKMGNLKPKHIVRNLQSYAADCDNYLFEERTAAIVQEYRNRLKSFNAVDFTLLLTETLELFRRFPDVFNYYHDKWQYVAVDEYQDVDHTQYYLHESLKPNNLFCVGDLDQSIYGFRGSSIQIILDFEKDHPGAEVIKLEQSYRCPSNVIEAANNLIKNNPQRYDKTLWTENPINLFSINVYENPAEEAQKIATQIEELPEAAMYSDVAILTRTHAQHESFKQAFDEMHVPYKLIGGDLNFWKSQVSRVVISILKVLHNKRDSWNFKRIAKEIIYPMGDADWTAYEVKALKEQRRVIDILVAEKAGRFAELLEWYSEDESGPVDVVVNKIIELLCLHKHYMERDLIHRIETLDNVSFKSSVWAMENPSANTVADFLAWLADQDVQSEIDNSDTVKVATIHAVKGLEMNIVFLAGVNEGRLPHKRSTTEEEIQEERRLMYVAVTRVKKQLWISSTKTDEFGRCLAPVEPSRFIAEMIRQ